LHLVGILFPHINDDALSKSHQIYIILEGGKDCGHCELWEGKGDELAQFKAQ